jgi:hypothetical protein
MGDTSPEVPDAVGSPEETPPKAPFILRVPEGANRGLFIRDQLKRPEILKAASSRTFIVAGEGEDLSELDLSRPSPPLEPGSSPAAE